ncbi:DUF2254 domain-containing protein [Aliishimia ponticola]|uniref:DUF2254 domain-containing protein n=1 Tax=Aliishimia ponticola TaxID=2499833 RepID=A0A4S4NSJ2_9RHOB|nr:DUF2254 domain-containing protein [Aliishimia ponticola]
MRILHGYLRLLWVRVTAMGILGIVTIAVSQGIEALLPVEWQSRISGAAADRLLDLIANGMLAVTTFSLTVMVSTYHATASQFTPRIHQLIREDAITQNTLATFIGAYVYALTAIVLREVTWLGDERALVLFCMTVLVLALIVWSLIRWMQHLQTLGSLINSARQVEDITRTQFRERLDMPCLGATPLTGAPPEDGIVITAPETGYIQIIHPEPLHEAAERMGVQIYFLEEIGSFVFYRTPFVRVTGLEDDDEAREELAELVRENIVMGDERTFDQDPRFGLQTMSQIASKALSPGINDPGTAIDVINRSGRILSEYRDETDAEDSPPYPRLHARPLDARELISDAFWAINRDGAQMVEVQKRLLKVLAGLMYHPDTELCEAAQEAATDYLHRALDAMDWDMDRDALQSVLGDKLGDAAGRAGTERST